MPLMRPAKALMAAESTLSVVTVLLVAARAVNILVRGAIPGRGRTARVDMRVDLARKPPGLWERPLRLADQA
jgi:hypothetical protein